MLTKFQKIMFQKHQHLICVDINNLNSPINLINMYFSTQIMVTYLHTSIATKN